MKIATINTVSLNFNHTRDMSNIIQIKPEDFGLTEKKAQEVGAMFRPMLDKMEALEGEFNQVIEMTSEGITPEAVKAAKEVRLKYVKVRTGTAKIHKELKAFYLQGGRFVDGWKNAQKMASEGKEEKLKEIELYFENLEKKRIAQLQEERAAELSQYQEENIPTNLGDMDDAVWGHFIQGAKTNYEARIEAERKAEEERIAERKAEAEERERIRLENERLKAEAAERERLAKIEEEKRAKAEAERKAKEESERKAREEEARRIEEENRQRLESERKAREAAEAEARKAQEEADRIKREKEEEEARLKAEKDARIEAEKNKGDSERLEDLIGQVKALDLGNFKSKKNQDKMKKAEALLNQLVSLLQE